jgi:hypothetical protein
MVNRAINTHRRLRNDCMIPHLVRIELATTVPAAIGGPFGAWQNEGVLKTDTDCQVIGQTIAEPCESSSRIAAHSKWHEGCNDR